MLDQRERGFYQGTRAKQDDRDYLQEQRAHYSILVGSLLHIGEIIQCN